LKGGQVQQWWKWWWRWWWCDGCWRCGKLFSSPELEEVMVCLAVIYETNDTKRKNMWQVSQRRHNTVTWQ